MIWRVRRVLTGHDAEGKSTVIADGFAANMKEMPAGSGLAVTELWESAVPADNAGTQDAGNRSVRLEPPKHGTLFRIVEFPPDAQWRDRADAREAFKSIAAAHAPDKKSADPMMHRTNTVDYIVVLKGEIYAVMEKGETLLRAGDVLVQRGTNHSWSVRGNDPCIIGVVLVNAKPLPSAKKKPSAKKAPAKKAKKKSGARF